MFLIHYGWRGTFFTESASFRPDQVSNPLRLEGDCQKALSYRCSKKLVSNPLRLEGDEKAKQMMKKAIAKFLIHYGWRGTMVGKLDHFRRFWFLIHYGWRGTLFSK